MTRKRAKLEKLVQTAANAPQLVDQALKRKARVLSLLKSRFQERAIFVAKITIESQHVADALTTSCRAMDRVAIDLAREQNKLLQLLEFLQQKPGKTTLSAKPQNKRRAVARSHSVLFDLPDEQDCEDTASCGLASWTPRSSKKRTLTLSLLANKRQKLDTCPELVEIQNKLRTLSQTIQCHESSNLTLSLRNTKQSADNLFVANDLCTRCLVPYLSLAKESRVVCEICARPKTSHLPGGPSPVTDADADTAKTTKDRMQTYQVFLLQFMEGTWVPLSVFARLNQEFARNLHIYAASEMKIGKVRDLLERLKLREWLPYSHRITLQLMRMPIPSFRKDEIELMVAMYGFLYKLHLELPNADKTFPNPKRVTEMILIWRKQFSFARCFPSPKTATKRPQFVIFDRMTQYLEEAQRCIGVSDSRQSTIRPL